LHAASHAGRRRAATAAGGFTTAGQPALALVSCTAKVVCKPVTTPPALTTPPTIHAACDERLGPLAAAHTEADNLRAPRGALLYSPRSGHGLEEVSLDLMADP